MSAKIACIAGEEIHRQFQAGRIAGSKLGSRPTPFGPSGDVLLIEDGDQPFYLLARTGSGLAKVAPQAINVRANMYALKDLGVDHVLSWGPAGAITHSISVGDMVIPGDVIDLTTTRAKTFYENSPLGFLRQFPVFCPWLRMITADVLESMKLMHQPSGVMAVSDGPRLETPAEVRMLETMGAELVTHCFVPEMFLAKELQMCYASICYIVNYAETGSRHKPFMAGELFSGLTTQSDSERLSGVVSSMTQIVRNVAALVARSPKNCECDKTMAHSVKAYGLDSDWRTWF